MKRIYWRPRAVSRSALLLIALLSLVGLLGVEHIQVRRQRPDYEAKIAAAKTALIGLETVKIARLSKGHPIDYIHTDPTDSGLIGDAVTQVTSVAGSLPAKQASINPNFAAVVVDMLKKAGVEQTGQNRSISD